MILEQFADKYKVRIRRDSCDDPIIPGRVKGAKRPEDSHHVYEISGQFFVYLNFPSKGRWNNARKRLIAAGARALVTGDADGLLGFEPEDEPLVGLILRSARIRVKRKLTEEQRVKLRARFAKKS